MKQRKIRGKIEVLGNFKFQATTFDPRTQMYNDRVTSEEKLLGGSFNSELIVEQSTT